MPRSGWPDCPLAGRRENKVEPVPSSNSAMNGLAPAAWQSAVDPTASAARTGRRERSREERDHISYESHVFEGNACQSNSREPFLRKATPEPLNRGRLCVPARVGRNRLTVHRGGRKPCAYLAKIERCGPTTSSRSESRTRRARVHYPSNFARRRYCFNMKARRPLLAQTRLNGTMNRNTESGTQQMSKIAKESILLLSLFLIAATMQFFAQSLPMALCFYFLPTLYSAYFFGRRHATLTAFACIFLVVLMDFLNNL